jgi:putative DNA primase/helicase
MSQPLLKLFTNPALLRHLDRPLLRPLLGRFTYLLQNDHGLPNIDALDNPYYFDCLAERLASPASLPDQLLQALHEIETLAAPENHPDILPTPGADPADIYFELLTRAVQSWLLRPLVPPPGQQPTPTEEGVASRVATQPSQDREPPVPQPFAANTPATPAQDLCALRVSALSSPSVSTQPTPSPTTDLHQNPPTSERNPEPTTPPPASPSHEISDQNLCDLCASALKLPPPCPQTTPLQPEATAPPPPAPLSALPSSLSVSAPSPLSASEADTAAFTRLARLSPADYDRVRRTEAAALKIRVETLDSEVAKRRAQLEIESQAGSIHLPDIIPWPEPVDGAQLLIDVSDRFSLHIVLPAGAADTMSLWTAHAHAFKAFYLIPRLNLCSTKSGCGKTTTLDVLTALVPRPLRAENLTAPVLFRLIHRHQPTPLLDEVDTYLHDDELRGLLNAGHKRGGCAFRIEGEIIRAFNAFAPAVLAGIGSLPGTLRDRSILIPLVPAEPGQIRKRWDPLHTETETILARKLARWAADNLDALAACEPALPQTAYNRIADIWRPLFAIAQIAGGPWPQRAFDAFALLNPKTPSDQDLALTLLADIRLIFTQANTDRLFSTAVVSSLRLLPGRPWSTNTNPPLAIDESWLARQLRPLGVRPRNLRIAGTRAKGYLLADFPQQAP